MSQYFYENLRSRVLDSIIQGGGIDCSKFGEADYQAEDNGIWMRVQSFRPWVETRIFEETFPGENL